ncbi:adenosylcobinamide-phosphate synthase CbiB [Roseiterribacter gracilis]|uniref:adenosylcobinamide-phosphate synthase CbiB n=1 Tax=Roseiterribacter gracilis TaxID=2812848 RepID=UPI003B4297B2
MPDAAGTAAALLLEAAVGYPDALHRRIPHPVVAIGRAIDALARRWNHGSDADRQQRGVATVALIAGGAATVGVVATRILPRPMVPVVATLGLAQRSLFLHVHDVQRALARDDLAAARIAVARIVGRDTSNLDESGVAAAALESLAESFCDGIVAPAFWFWLGGLAGLFAYKVVNTADSMIGHREEPWRKFGWAAARSDDAMNWIPARIAGALLAIAGRGGFGTMLRDARKHASPNAGWPEAAMAGALQVQLGGPATYDGVTVERPSFGNGRKPDAADLARGLRVTAGACVLLCVGVGLLALAGARKCRR